MALARKHSINQLKKVMKTMGNKDIGTESNTKIIPNQVYMDNPFIASNQQKKRAITSIDDYMHLDIPEPSEPKFERAKNSFENFVNEKTNIEKGIDVQKEHSSTWHKIKKYYEEHDKMPPQKLFYTWIATDHDKEFDDYYDALEKMEKELKKKHNENAVSIISTENHELNANDISCAKFKIRRYLRDNRMLKDFDINNALVGQDDYILDSLKNGVSVEEMAKTIFSQVDKTSDVTEITEKKDNTIDENSKESTAEKSPQDIMRDMKTIANFKEFITRKTFNPKERDILTAGKWIEKGKIKGYINRIEGGNIFLEIDGEVKEYKIKDVI